MKKSIGIIGGMGPLATADLFEKIIHATDAARDQDFPHVIVDCNTDIPDRTAAILSGGEDPVPQLVRSAHALERPCPATPPTGFMTSFAGTLTCRCCICSA